MEKNIEKLVREPVFFERNRVYRIYKGGAPYKEIFNDENGYDDGTDNMFPEEWVASKVRAVNPRYFGERDGVSVVEGTDIFFDDLLKEHSESLLGTRKYDCLVKFLDSAIRLPFQVHPTKEFSRKHFNSEYGKTEAWLVVGKREGAKIYFGFKNPITKEELSEYEERSETEKDVMGGLLYGVDAEVGDVWLIKAGLIHAIGAGCTIIEVQEPTDFTIQPERWCGDYHISYNEEYIGLDKDVALDSINFEIYGERAAEYARVIPRTVTDAPTYKKEVLIDYSDTACFAQNRHTLRDGGKLTLGYAPSVYICLSGNAVIKGDGYSREISRGDYFYLPYAAQNKFTVENVRGISGNDACGHSETLGCKGDGKGSCGHNETSASDVVLIECLPSYQPE